MMSTQPDGYYTDPMWEELLIPGNGPCHAKGCLKDYIKRLEETGREWAIPLLKERHPKEFAN